MGDHGEIALAGLRIRAPASGCFTSSQDWCWRIATRNSELFRSARRIEPIVATLRHLIAAKRVLGSCSQTRRSVRLSLSPLSKMGTGWELRTSAPRE